MVVFRLFEKLRHSKDQLHLRVFSKYLEEENDKMVALQKK